MQVQVLMRVLGKQSVACAPLQQPDFCQRRA